MSLRVLVLSAVVFTIMSCIASHAQFTITVAPDPVIGGTRETVTVTVVLSVPHNGALINFFNFAQHAPVQLAPGQTTTTVEMPAPGIVSTQTTVTYSAAAAYNGPTLVAQDVVTVNPVELRMDLTQNPIASGPTQVIGSVSLSPAAVTPVFVSFTTNPVSVLFPSDVTIPPGGSASVEVVAASVAEATNVELTASVFTITGFLTAINTVAVLPSQPQGRTFLEGSIVGSVGSVTRVELDPQRMPVVQVPIGGQLMLRLLRAVGEQSPEPVASVYALNEHVELDGPDHIAAEALFAGRVVLEYNRGPSSIQKFFQAVHR